MIAAAPRLRRDDALFLDFDGTLVEIAATPQQVKADKAVARLLGTLARRHHGAVAVVSGRPLAELDRLLQPYRGAMAGIHGLERRAADGTVTRPEGSPFLGAARPFVELFAATTPGVVVEDKGLAIALHYRTNPNLAQACFKLVSGVARSSHYRLAAMRGKMMVELHPWAANKGLAILNFLDEPPFQGRRPVFVGDDFTDEDGFAVINHLGGVSIHVGSAEKTRASFRLRDVSAVIDWLEQAQPSASSDRAMKAAS